MIRPALSLVMLLGSCAAMAGECVGSPDVVAACEDAAEADKALNDAYGSLVRRLGDRPDAKASLVEAQRAWIKFRALDCEAVFDLADGTSGAPLAMSCETEHARQRTAQLKAMAASL